MRSAAFWTIVSALSLSSASPADGASGFQKVSAHFYYLESKTGAANTGVIVTQEGVVLIDPPAEQDVPALLNALRSLTARPVRWVISTDYQQARSGGTATFLKLGAALIYSKELDRLAANAPSEDPDAAAGVVLPRPNPRFLFDHLLHLFPSGIETRILAVNGKARTAGDVVVFIPSEKILDVGDLVTPGSFPVIDGPGEGTALGWIDGLKQVVDFVPLLKAAIPQPKPEANAPVEPEKSLEEQVTVISARAAPSNLQQVKSLLSAAQKLRAEASRAVEAGRTRDEFVKSLSPDAFGDSGNLENFAGQLFDEISKK